MRATPVALVGGTVYPGPEDPPIADGVLVFSERIAAVGRRGAVTIPPEAERIDCAGLAICAGFWNSHVHFFERKWADAASIPADELGRQLEGMLTRFGFTSVFDLSSPWENTRALRARIESGEIDGPAIRATGQGLIPAGGAPSDTVIAMMGVIKVTLPEIADEAQAASGARRLVADGVDGVKLFASAGRSTMPEPVIAAAAAVAHEAGKPVFAHPNSAADVLRAVRAGVDVVAHTTPASGPWSEETLAAMVERRVALTPTLTLWSHYARHDRLSAQERIVETELGQLRAWKAAGGEVLFGTDLGAVEYDPTPEYRLMAAAGLRFTDILDSLTTAPARRFGDSGGGRIAAGLRADLTVVEGDPAADIAALGRVRCTFRGGRMIYGR